VLVTGDCMHWVLVGGAPMNALVAMWEGGGNDCLAAEGVEVGVVGVAAILAERGRRLLELDLERLLLVVQKLPICWVAGRSPGVDGESCSCCAVRDGFGFLGN
jgi:tetrahydromethanopterin S-methyltransferase subunit D